MIAIQASMVQLRYRFFHERSVLTSLRTRVVCLIGALFLLFSISEVAAQTDFAPGQIMFTGYDSDDPDAFSIVLLTDVVAGTDIYITDRGWSNTTGFRVDNTNEGTIKFSFT